MVCGVFQAFWCWSCGFLLEEGASLDPFSLEYIINCNYMTDMWHETMLEGYLSFGDVSC